MKKSGRRLFIFSFLLAILATIFVYLYLNSLSTEPEKIEQVKILVAAQDIPARTIITENMIMEKEISVDSNFGEFVDERSEIVGKYSKENIYLNERFSAKAIIQELEEEVSLKINGNHRAVSLLLSGESGVSDLMKPGDRVDVFVFLPSLKEGPMTVRPDIVKLMMQNLEVLSIDKNLYRDEESRQEIPNSYYVTLSVPVFEVEKLILAEDIGNIKLALRPLEGDFAYQSDGTIWQELLLDDFYKMKDMFPQYEVKPFQGILVDENEYAFEKYIYYTVQYGDTLRSISGMFYNDESLYDLIMQVNRISDEDVIIAGTGLKIPVLSTQE